FSAVFVCMQRPTPPFLPSTALFRSPPVTGGPYGTAAGPAGGREHVRRDMPFRPVLGGVTFRYGVPLSLRERRFLLFPGGDSRTRLRRVEVDATCRHRSATAWWCTAPWSESAAKRARSSRSGGATAGRRTWSAMRTGTRRWCSPALMRSLSQLGADRPGRDRNIPL